MLNYNEFTEKFMARINDYLPEGSTYTVYFNKVQKINRELDTVTLYDKNATLSVGPCIYMQDIYEHYRKTEDFESVVKSSMDKLVELVKTAPVVPEINKESIQDKIFAQVINADQNEELLAKVPHRDFEDLSIIYRGMVSRGTDDIGSFIIDNNFVETNGITEDELYEKAMENTPKLMPFQVKSMQEVLRRMFMESGMPEEVAQEMVEHAGALENQMFVVSNTGGLMGANALLFSEPFEQISEKLGGDLYIIPSSIHELIVVGTQTVDVENLTEMVHEVNMTEVDLADRLSNEVYMYDHLTKEISCISDSPYKSLTDEEPAKDGRGAI